MRRILPLLVILLMGFAPAPFPRPARRPAVQALAGTWDVDWGGTGARLYLRPSGSARFEYAHNKSFWNGSWTCRTASRLTLTLLQDGVPTHDYLTFDNLGPDSAAGKVRQGPSWERSV